MSITAFGQFCEHFQQIIESEGGLGDKLAVGVGSDGGLRPPKLCGVFGKTLDGFLQQSRLQSLAQCFQSETHYPARMQLIPWPVCFHWVYLYGYLLLMSSSTGFPYLIAPFKINAIYIKKGVDMCVYICNIHVYVYIHIYAYE